MKRSSAEKAAKVVAVIDDLASRGQVEEAGKIGAFYLRRCAPCVSGKEEVTWRNRFTIASHVATC